MNEHTKPDYEIEQFWLQFKNTMNNFYTNNKNITKRNISRWSDTLNKFQAKAQYDKIEKYIMDYITLHGLDIIKTGKSYELQLLNTNIKRWNKITQRNKIFNESNENITQEYSNLFYTCVQICIALTKSDSSFDYKEIFEDIELIIINNDITELIEYSVLFSKPIIIDKLITYNRNLVTQTIIEIYNDEIFKGICKKTYTGKTILKRVNEL
jgi:hypothetical protein